MKNQSIAQLYTSSFHNNWDNLAFSDYEGKDFKYKEIAELIKSLHLFYQISGIRRGDKIAVLGRNSAHWGASFLSAISAGLVPVPIMPDFNEHDTNHIINHSESKIVIGSKALLDKIDFEKAPNLRTILALEDFSLFVSGNAGLPYYLKK